MKNCPVTCAPVCVSCNPNVLDPVCASKDRLPFDQRLFDPPGGPRSLTFTVGASACPTGLGAVTGPLLLLFPPPPQAAAQTAAAVQIIGANFSPPRQINDMSLRFL